MPHLRKHEKGRPLELGLTTQGVFGPILQIVLVDAAKGKVVWNRWEMSAKGPVAVFRFTVPEDRSHYQVTWCCDPTIAGDMVSDVVSAYHGNMTVDPETGTILRLELVADPSLLSLSPVSRADLMVQFGPVDLGSKIYFCPLRSVSITRAPIIVEKRIRGQVTKSLGPEKDMLNDVVYSDYHLLRSYIRILSENPSSDPPNSVPGRVR